MKNLEQSPIDVWADQKIKELLVGSILNLKFRQSGLCKLFIEMNDAEYVEYKAMISSI